MRASALHFPLSMKRPLTLGTFLAGLSIVAGVATALLFSSCSSVQRALNIQNPSYSIRDIRPRVDVALPLSASTIDLDFAVDVTNPNKVGLRLDGIDFDLLVNDAHVLNSVSTQNIQIPANGHGTMQLQTRIGYNNIRSMWSEMVNVIQGNRARYELRGNAHYDTPLGRMTFPVTVYSSR
jgi:LEA14-like dessication related protein